VQGITGSFGARHTQLSLAYGTQVVAGVTPGKGGQKFESKVPIFDTVAEAVRETGATASAIFVPPPFAATRSSRASTPGSISCVCITEGIPVNDMVKVKRAMQGRKTGSLARIVRASSRRRGQGFARRLSHWYRARYIHKKGNVGVVSRSGTLTYEAVWQLTCRGVGQSTCVGIGGDPVNGTSHLDVIKMFNDDPEQRGSS
jgi:succinyl-CoA synthetase alpha subunit